MSAEKVIRYQSRQKLKMYGYTKPLFSLGIIFVFVLLVDCVSIIEPILLGFLDTSKSTEFAIKIACRSLSVISAFLLSPVLLGFVKMMCIDSHEYDIKDLLYFFKGFKTYLKSLAFISGFILRIVIPAVLSFSFFIIQLLVENLWFTELKDNIALDISLVLFFIIGVLLTLRFSIKYFLAFLLLCKDKSKPISYYFSTSKKLMKSNSKNVVKLSNSFTGWILLCITVLPALYVIPYYTQAMCICGKWLIELSGNEQINELF
ncbi:MAG: DUF975 family protein [Ruminococcus sp.]|nr:DUF975 family protein [Ruminococcus sp.]